MVVEDLLVSTFRRNKLGMLLGTHCGKNSTMILKKPSRAPEISAGDYTLQWHTAVRAAACVPLMRRHNGPGSEGATGAHVPEALPAVRHKRRNFHH